MATDTLRIATRRSPLALWQAEHVADHLRRLHRNLEVTLIKITTAGDRFVGAPLATAGGKGLFIKELEQCLAERRADLAVHSMKDVTVELPAGLGITVLLPREDPRDVLVAASGASLNTLVPGARVGTSSLRRQSQLRALRPDLRISDLRGNVGTRLKRLENGEFDAIILAAAGVKRLGLVDRVSEFLAPDILVPAAGQGVIGVETRQDDARVRALTAPLNDPATETCINAERAVSRRLYGGCLLPVAAHACLQDDQVSVQGLVARADGSEVIYATRTGPADKAEIVGIGLAEELLTRGADRILAELVHD